MTLTTTAALKASWEELPFSQLLEVETTNLTDEQKRELLKVVQERQVSPQKRRSVASKTEKKLSGKKTGIDISGLL